MEPIHVFNSELFISGSGCLATASQSLSVHASQTSQRFSGKAFLKSVS